MVLPNNIPLLMGMGYDDAITTILSEPDNHIQNIVRLSKICRVKVTFHCSQSFYVTRRKRVENVTEHIFPEFFNLGDTLYYKMKRGGRTGFQISMSNIRSYEPVLESKDEFKSYEDFKKKFDLTFIKEDLIKELWNDKSAQHGGRYKPSDFKSISSAGREALRMFLLRFKGLDNTDTSTYSEMSFDGTITHYIKGVHYGTGSSNSSRDVRISHSLGMDRVWYSSEYHGTGNGTYGLLASRSKYLWLEND